MLIHYFVFRIVASHPNIREAVLELVSAVTRCKFEATDSVADEAVLASILMLLSLIIDSEAGLATLDDKSVCEMVEVAFGMLFQGRVSGKKKVYITL